MMDIINTHSDLDALVRSSPDEARAFVLALRASTARCQDTAARPPGYGSPDYDGPIVDPLWVSIDDFSALNRLGISLDDLAALEARFDLDAS